VDQVANQPPAQPVTAETMDATDPQNNPDSKSNDSLNSSDSEGSLNLQIGDEKEEEEEEAPSLKKENQMTRAERLQARGDKIQARAEKRKKTQGAKRAKGSKGQEVSDKAITGARNRQKEKHKHCANQDILEFLTSLKEEKFNSMDQIKTDVLDVMNKLAKIAELLPVDSNENQIAAKPRLFESYRIKKTERAFFIDCEQTCRFRICFSRRCIRRNDGFYFQFDNA
jgi:hypothetical protein